MDGLSLATTLVSGLLTLLYLCVPVCYLYFSCTLQTSTIFTVGPPVPVDIVPIAGGVVGGLIAVILVVLMVIVLVVFLVQRVKGETTMMCVQCAVMSALVV